MRNLIKLLSLLTIVALFASCNKEDIQITQEGEEIATSGAAILTFVAHAERNDGATKTTLTGAEFHDINWLPDEKVNIFYKGESYQFASTNVSEKATVDFSGTIDGIEDLSQLEENVYALYPYDANATISGSSITTVLPSEQVAKKGTFSSDLFISVGTSNEIKTIHFYNVCSGAYFSVDHDNISSVVLSSNDETPLAGGITIEVGETPSISNITDGVNSITVYAPDGGTFEKGERYYIVTLPATLSSGITMTAHTTDGDFYERKATRSQKFVRSVMNKALNFDKGLTKQEREDMGMEDVFGNPLPGLSTANCYVIRENGHYKIPMVYGNAIKDNEVNTKAFRSSLPASEEILSNFIDHKGNDISQPWVSQAYNISKAALLWQDAAGLVSNVGITGSPNVKEEKYVTFDVNSFVQGNAVIAVYDENGTIAWSWHIWCYNGSLETLAVTNDVNVVYDVLNVNLGFCDPYDASKPETINGGLVGNSPYYQWGRKDPMLPSDGNKTNANKKVYNAAKAEINAFEYMRFDITKSEFGKPVISYWISHPYQWVNYQYTLTDPETNETNKYAGWGDAAYSNLWSINQKFHQVETTHNYNNGSDQIVEKTIYDPCPVGFTLPTSRTFRGFVTYQGDTSYTGNAILTNSLVVKPKSVQDDNGLKIYTDKSKSQTIFFPLTGNRRTADFAEGKVTNSKEYSYHWSAHAYNDHAAINFHFRSTPSVNTAIETCDRMNKSNTLVIRPIKEKEPGSGNEPVGEGEDIF